MSEHVIPIAVLDSDSSRQRKRQGPKGRRVDGVALDEGKPSGSGVPGSKSANLAAALQSAKQALADGQAALAKGDFTAYGQAQDRLKSAIAAAINAQAGK